VPCGGWCCPSGRHCRGYHYRPSILLWSLLLHVVIPALWHCWFHGALCFIDSIVW
jgi:hypothetical protein